MKIMFPELNLCFKNLISGVDTQSNQDMSMNGNNVEKKGFACSYRG